MPEFVRTYVPAIVIPLVVFGANWAFRQRNGYALTASADFILAVLIFDGTVVSSSETFTQFVQNAELRATVVNYHLLFAALGCLLWWAIAQWCERPLAAYYEEGSGLGGASFPIVAFALCWMGAFVLISIHVLFFIHN
jgi:hypothetical protein